MKPGYDGPPPVDLPEEDCPKTPQTLDDLGFERQPMVDWLAPAQLARTGLQVYMASAFGSFLDKREMQAFTSKPRYEEDYAADTREIWFDYIADLGDGFNPTYAMARLLARPELGIAGRALPRGRFLVLGGDQVYPTASHEEYNNRLQGPFQAALPYAPYPWPHVFAIPGNHDWYDGLTSFMRLFGQFYSEQDTRWLGGWQTRQGRSYFALKLPAGWWLWGTDVQLSSDVDRPQIDYFKEVARHMRAESEEPRLILVTAQPSWVWCGVEEPGAVGVRNPEEFDSLEFFESRIIRENGIRLALVLSGDLHHYCRYEQEEGGPGATQRITSGGGGAYLYATHQMPRTIEVPEEGGPGYEGRAEEAPKVRYQRKTAYPSVETSKNLSWGVLLLPLRNWSFSLLLGAFYVLFGWSLDREHPFNPASFLVGLLFIAIFFGYARAQGRPFRPWLPVFGALHGLAHVGLGAGLFRVLSRLSEGFEAPWSWLAMAAGMLAGGYVFGGLLFAVYLFVASRIWCGHTGELFSSQAIQDYKSFLRLHIAEDGTLTVHVLGLRKVPRRWRLRPEAEKGEPWLEPEPGEPPLEAHLIEKIEIR